MTKDEEVIGLLERAVEILDRPFVIDASELDKLSEDEVDVVFRWVMKHLTLHEHRCSIPRGMQVEAHFDNGTYCSEDADVLFRFEASESGGSVAFPDSSDL